MDLKNSISLRGDNYYCPLCLQIDSYWACLNNCHNCFMRRFNRTWGQEQRFIDLTILKSKLDNGLRNNKPSTPLAWALKNKKTIRIGNKTDPYQDIEKEKRLTREVIKLLNEREWTSVIQTKYTENLLLNLDILNPALNSIMPIISPGLGKDWEVFERKGTTHPDKRLEHCQLLIEKGFNVGVNGEPFIPGYHTVDDFYNTIRRLQLYHIKSYNTYPIHMNDLVAKNLHNIGIDIEKIWIGCQDENWKPILKQLIQISKDAGIILGCPDFINSGEYQESSNTCCGLNVPNPCTFNLIQWKKLKLAGLSTDEILSKTWDCVGDISKGRELIEGDSKEVYTLNDIKIEGRKPIIRANGGLF